MKNKETKIILIWQRDAYRRRKVQGQKLLNQIANFNISGYIFASQVDLLQVFLAAKNGRRNESEKDL